MPVCQFLEIAAVVVFQKSALIVAGKLNKSCAYIISKPFTMMLMFFYIEYKSANFDLYNIFKYILKQTRTFKVKTANLIELNVFNNAIKILISYVPTITNAWFV